jgi:hypothetical protein
MFTRPLKNRLTMLSIIIFCLGIIVAAAKCQIGGGSPAPAVFDWGQSIGGTGNDGGYSIAVDSNGDSYVTGWFEGDVDFDQSGLEDSKTSVGSTDIFLTKIASDGSYYWTKTFGSDQGDQGNCVTLDASGNLYLTGSFSETVDFNPDSGDDSKTSNGGNDIFLTKINSNGSYGSTITFGGTGADSGNAVKVDSTGNIYIAGSFRNTVDFDFGSGTNNQSSAGFSDIFLSKIFYGGAYAWTYIFGGTGTDSGYALAVDSSNNVYIAGSFSDTVDFYPGGLEDNKTSAGNTDIFITKINADSSYAWTKTMGGSGLDSALSLALDSNDNLFVTGFFSDTVDFNPDTETDSKVSNGGSDAFLAKFNADGSYAWALTFGGTSEDIGYSLTTDQLGSIYIAGSFSDTVDFDPGDSISSYVSQGSSDSYILKIQPIGFFDWVQTLGGTGFDVGYSVALDRSENILLTGQFSDTVNFNPLIGSEARTSNGSTDIFIIKFDR